MVHNQRNQWAALGFVLLFLLARHLLVATQVLVLECLLVCLVYFNFKSAFSQLISWMDVDYISKCSAEDVFIKKKKKIYWLPARQDELIKRHKQGCQTVPRRWEMAFSLRVRVLACAECKETLSVYSLFVFTAGNQGDKIANLTMGPPRKITSHQPLLGPRRSPPPRGLRRTPTHTVEYARATHPRSKRTRGGERRRTRKSDMTCNFIKHTCCSSMCVRQGDVRALARSLTHTKVAHSC